MRQLFSIAAAALALLLTSCGSSPEHAQEWRGALPSVLLPSAPSYRNEALLHSDGERLVRISLARQRGELLVGGQQAMSFPVCTGKDDSTPVGSYRILEKDIDHRSNLYHVAMPYFMRLTYDGIGLHVGEVFSSPVSHGCIRLHRADCVPLYHAAPIGTPVEIVSD